MKTDKKPEYYLGIDGGATKTVYALEDAAGNRIKELRGLPCNPFDLGFDEATKRLGEGIREILSGVAPSEVSVFAGLSGGVSGDMRDRIRSYLDSFGFMHASNGSDMDNALWTALGKDDGLCVIIGTGNVICARLKNEVRRFGGYGYYFDNTLSGFDLGRLAIAAALHADEGTGPCTVLSESVKEKCGSGPLSSLSAFYEKGKSYIASFAPLVFDGARKGDAVCRDICRIQAEKLAAHINSAVKCTGYTEKVKLCFIGGLCRERDAFENGLVNALDTAYFSSIEFCTEGQENGALLLARSL